MPWPLAILIAALIVVPPLLAPQPPVLDLPQQLAQISLLDEAWNDPTSPLSVAWSAPNKLSYPVLALAFATGRAEWAPRLTMMLCGGILTIGILHLARRLGRPVEQASLASIFVYSGAYYGGFLSFIVGGAVYAAWATHLREPRSAGVRLWSRRVLFGCLLYYAHVLWLAVAGLTVMMPRSGIPGLRHRVGALWALAPFALAAVLWYAAVATRIHAEPPRYEQTPLQRLLELDHWGRWIICGLRSPWELWLLMALALWAMLSLAFRDPATAPDAWLLGLAVLFAALGTFLPDAMGFTVLLAQRWMPWAAICGLLALPLPRIRRLWRIGFVCFVLCAHLVVTALAWRAHALYDLKGFASSLAAVEDGSRLLGLDFVRSSPRFWIGPYSHMSAYAQLDRRVQIGVSFVGAPSALLVREESTPEDPWTRGLEHDPRRLAPSDLDFFDLLLVHAREDVQARIRGLTPRLRPVAGETPWVLYSVRPETEAAVAKDD